MTAATTSPALDAPIRTTTEAALDKAKAALARISRVTTDEDAADIALAALTDIATLVKEQG